MKRKILIGLLVVLVVIQFIRPEKNNGQADTPQDLTHSVQVSQPVMTTLKTACYNCHSNHTDYPWYSNVNPVGLWLANHIEEGKEELNFSEFSTYDKKRKDHKLEEIAEEVEEGHMPMPAYTLVHQDAKLSEAQKTELIEWVKAERKRLAQMN
ncbi:heme-binding domain-containing protein [Larkinella soli]|uniref:heme-binding domain-containing protein n=1 Tax=Larkinella soli TaxID=1770527 RepID=UPI000FFB588B|nr:heme-binding domain-containing protein [Larkinella soli]